VGNDDSGDAGIVCKDAIDAVGEREQVFKLNVWAAYIDNLLDLDICKLLDFRHCFDKVLSEDVPPLYSATLVELAPVPAIVPPVESTQTSGSSLLLACCAQQEELQANPDASTALQGSEGILASSHPLIRTLLIKSSCFCLRVRIYIDDRVEPRTSPVVSGNLAR
jgi:hypothetical protein